MAAAQPREQDAEGISPEHRQQVDAVREIFVQFLKGSKSIGLYRHNTPRFPEFMQKTFDLLTAYLEGHEALTIKVETSTFALYGQPLLPADADSRMPYKFHQEGIRHLVFRRGLTLDELVKFALITATNFDDAKNRGQDVLSLLWAAAFEHLEYLVVQGFAVSDMSEEEVQVEVDKIVTYLYRRLRSASQDFMRFAAVSVDDVNLKMEAVDQVRGLVIQGNSITEKLAQQIQAELREDEGAKLLPKLVSVIFSILEDEADPASYQDIFSQLLDAMLLQEDFGTVNQLLVKLRALERKPDKAESVRQLRTFVLGKMGEPERLNRIVEILRATPPAQPQEIQRYLSALDTDAVVPLLEGLDSIELAENRRLLCDALAVVGGRTPEPFVSRLASPKSALVRDMIYIIEKLDVPDRARLFEPALRNPNLAVRLEALAAIGKGRSEAARTLIVAAMKDGNAQVRVQAAKSLVQFNAERGFQELAKLVKTPDFGKRDAAEKRATYGAMGASEQPAAIALFAQLLQQKAGLLNKRKIAEEKLFAIAGLAECPAIASYKLLQAEAENAGNEEDVLSEARKAMFKVQRKLFGDAQGQGG